MYRTTFSFLITEAPHHISHQTLFIPCPCCKHLATYCPLQWPLLMQCYTDAILFFQHGRQPYTAVVLQHHLSYVCREVCTG